MTEPRSAATREKTTAKRVGLGAIQAGEETFRVADPEPLGSAPDVAAEQTPAPARAAPAAVDAAEPEATQLELPPAAQPSEVLAATAPAPIAPAPAAPSVVEQVLPEASALPDIASQCTALRAAGRFAEAASLARGGLKRAGESSALLLELSRAELGLGHVEAAIDVARDAHFTGRSRETVAHLIRLLTDARRFVRQDGPAVRRAARRHPRQPLLLYAAGVFESMYGKACDAEEWLCAALPLAPDEEMRRAIAGELRRVEKARARGAS